MAKASHKKCNNRVLFICKVSDYCFGSEYVEPKKISGLRNSASFCMNVLEKAGIHCKLVVVRDNNDIDREVNKFKPTHVIIEALWVVPEKFVILNKLHPKVKWIIRIHSELPFVAGEGIAMEWIIKYVSYKNVYISGNSPLLENDLVSLIKTAYPDQDLTWKVIYLPNCYQCTKQNLSPILDPDRLNIGCFGAIRPLKNQLIQAAAAIDFADRLNVPINFHMNGDRIEQLGQPVLKNIKSLFALHPQHNLVLHDWMDHDMFLDVLSTMDIGLQVSLSESFNIVAADMVCVDIPMVVSPAIYWASDWFKANPIDKSDIVNKMRFAYKMSFFNFHNLNRIKLSKTCDDHAKIWIQYFRTDCDV